MSRRFAQLLLLSIILGVLYYFLSPFLATRHFPEEEDEAHCLFVSSRGLMKSCDIFPSSPVSSTQDLYSFDWDSVFQGAVVYVAGSAVPAFISNAFPRIKSQFTLVTGDCDESIPKAILSKLDFEAFISDARIKHWFSQNLVTKHEKMSVIPIGLDYHTLSLNGHDVWGPSMSPKLQEASLNGIAKLAPPLLQRALMCYSNFHFLTTTHYASDRLDAMKLVPRSLVYYEPTKLTRQQSWRTQSMMSFVLSPHGGGYDCHRTWEALALGCIPIVKSSPIDRVFEGLPVLIVQNWSDVSLGLLEQTRARFAAHHWALHRLTLSYWAAAIRNTTR